MSDLMFLINKKMNMGGWMKKHVLTIQPTNRKNWLTFGGDRDRIRITKGLDTCYSATYESDS